MMVISSAGSKVFQKAFFCSRLDEGYAFFWWPWRQVAVGRSRI